MTKLKCLLLAALAGFGLQGCYVHAVALDLDNNPNTGCSEFVNDANVAGDLVGIDAIALTGVFSADSVGMIDPNDPFFLGDDVGPIDVGFDPNNPPPFVVFGTFYGTCGGGDSFGLSTFIPALWPVGLNNGTNGADVVEFAIPRTLLQGHDQIRATFLSTNVFDLAPATVAQYTQALENGSLSNVPHETDIAPGTLAGFLIDLAPGTEAPAMSMIGLGLLVVALMVFAGRRLEGPMRGIAGAALVVSLAGIAYAATIQVNGDVADWTGIAALGTDPDGDSSSGDDAEDIVAVFATADPDNLYLRVDIKDVESGFYGPTAP